jgi:hypothetical protein
VYVYIYTYTIHLNTHTHTHTHRPPTPPFSAKPPTPPLRKSFDDKFVDEDNSRPATPTPATPTPAYPHSPTPPTPALPYHAAGDVSTDSMIPPTPAHAPSCTPGARGYSTSVADGGCGESGKKRRVPSSWEAWHEKHESSSSCVDEALGTPQAITFAKVLYVAVALYMKCYWAQNFPEFVTGIHLISAPDLRLSRLEKENMQIKRV